MTFLVRIFAIFILIFCISCNEFLTKRHVDNTNTKIAGKRILMLNPDIYIYEIGVAQLTPIVDLTDQSQNAYKSAVDNLSKEFKYNYVFQADTIETKGVRGILKASAETITQFEYPTKKNNFDYEIGDISNLLDKFKADYLVYSYGFDFERSSGKVATDLAVGILAAFAGYSYQPRHPRSIFTISIVDRDGKVQRFTKVSADNIDFITEKNMNFFIKKMFQNAKI